MRSLSSLERCQMNDSLMVDVGEKEFLDFVKDGETPTEASMRKIRDLDLEMVKHKLCLPVEQEGKGWSEQKVDKVEAAYKRYLVLSLLYRNESIVPDKLVDEMWHAHILDTHAYHEDCQDIFGYYLHHFPYFGLRGEEDAQDLKDSFEETKRLSQKHFGIASTGQASICKESGCASRCGHGH